MYKLPDLTSVIEYLVGLDDEIFDKVKDIVYDDYNKLWDWEEIDDLEILKPIFISEKYVEDESLFSKDLDNMVWHNRVFRDAARIYCNGFDNFSMHNVVIIDTMVYARNAFTELLCFIHQAVTLAAKSKNIELIPDEKSIAYAFKTTKNFAFLFSL
jgi:hypothetical protein